MLPVLADVRPHHRRRAARPAGPRHALAPGRRVARPGRGDPGDDGPARDRGAQRLPLAVGPGRRADRRRRRPGAVRRPPLVKQLAMRRTLFVFPRDLLPAAWGSASARVARPLAARLAKERRGRRARRGRRRLARPARRAVLARARRTAPALTAQELREQVPELAGPARDRARQAYGGQLPDRAAGAHPARRRGARSCAASNDGHWRPSGRAGPHPTWLGDVPEPRRSRGATPSWSAAGWRPSARAPRPTSSGGWARPRRAVRRALADLDAVEVALDGGGTGWVLPDDLDRRPSVEPWAALLPVLDPTVMGWKERGFYLGDARAAAVRHQRQRRHHRLVGRPDRRLLGPGPRRRRPGPPPGGRRPRAARAPWRSRRSG